MKKLFIVLFTAFLAVGCTQDELFTKNIGIIRYEVDGKPYQTDIKYQVDCNTKYPCVNVDIGIGYQTTGIVFRDHTGDNRNGLSFGGFRSNIECDSVWQDCATNFWKVGVKFPMDTPFRPDTKPKPERYAYFGFRGFHSLAENMSNETPAFLTITKNDENTFEATFECMISYDANRTKKAVIKNGFVSIRRN